MFMALKWIQSQADYNNVMQHLTLSPGEKKGNKELNEKDVINFLGIGEQKLFFTPIMAKSSPYCIITSRFLLTRMSHLNPYLTS